MRHSVTAHANSATTRRPRRNAARVKAKAPKAGEQLALARTGGWGGKRAGAGRKRSGSRSRVEHAKRPVHKGRHPVHVTLRARTGLPSFRQQVVHKLIAEVLRDQRRRAYKDDFRVLHFSIQANHLHLIVEADSERARPGYRPLRSGVSGLAIAFARRLNMMLRRRGKVWDDRYHRHDLKTPKEVHHAFGYVFDNYTHHGERSYGDGGLDLHSSARLFDGWSGPHVTFPDRERWWWPICRAQSWLARVGYIKHGRLTIVPRHP